jgi:filamin
MKCWKRKKIYLNERDIENFKTNNKDFTIRIEVYDWASVGTHQFLGAHTIHIRDYKDLVETTGKWVELWLVLKKRTSVDKVAGKVHIGIRINAPPDEEEIQKIVRPNKKLPTSEIEIPTADLSKTDILGVGLQEGKVKSGDTTSFDIVPIGTDGKKLGKSSDQWDVKIKGPFETSVPFNLVENEDGSYSVDYKPLYSGEHEIQISCNGKPISVDPFTINVLPGIDQKNCTVNGSCFDIDMVNLVDSPVCFEIQGMDSLGDELGEGGDKVEVEVDGPCEVVPSIKDLKNGRYEVEFTPKKGGKFHMNVKINDKTINTDGFDIDIKEKPDINKFKFDLDMNPYHLKPTKNKLKTYDRFGNPLDHGGDNIEVEIDGPEGEKVEEFVFDNDDGTYTISFVPEKPGKHKMKVKFNDETIPVQILDVKPITDPLNTLVDGPGLNGGDLLSGDNIPIKLNLQARGNIQ